MHCENYDTSDGNRTVLTVEGTYTSGDREGITVSHEIDFGTMQIKRNYLYKVRIALEDPAGDTYGKVTHAINVKDWTSGVTLTWAGDENLYNNLAAANFTVTGTERKLRDATVSDPEQHLVLPYNAEKSATFYVTSTSTKSGLSLTCPATAVAATAEEGGGYQCTITPQASTYSENGEFTQKWQVTVRESALQTGATLTFTLQNALNSALSASFEVIGAPFASEDDIQAGDVYYANGMWSRPANMEDCITYTGTTTTGIVAPVAAYESADGDVMIGTDYCAKLYSAIQLGDVYYADGFWSSPTSSVITSCETVSDAIGVVVYVNDGTTTGDAATEKDVKATGIGGHALVISLEANSTKYSWENATTVDHNNSLFPDVGNILATAQTDFKGYEKTKQMATKTGECATHTHEAAMQVWNYTPSGVTSGGYRNLSTGWFMLSIGQWMKVATAMGGTVNNARSDGTGTPNAKLKGYIEAAGGSSNYLIACEDFWSSSEMNNTNAENVHWHSGSQGFHWGNTTGKTSKLYVRPFLAF